MDSKLLLRGFMLRDCVNCGPGLYGPWQRFHDLSITLTRRKQRNYLTLVAEAGQDHAEENRCEFSLYSILWRPGFAESDFFEESALSRCPERIALR